MITAAPPGIIDGPIWRTVSGGPTDVWNDSCAVDELAYAIERGATGATSNPSIVLEVLRKEHDHWIPWLHRRIEADGSASETDITWSLIEAMAIRGAGLLAPVFEREGGQKGRLSIQTDPTNYRHVGRMLDQGLRFAGLAPNIQVKFPATRAGIDAIEQATAAGVQINATVCFTVAQAIAVAEAVERGLSTRAARGDAVGTIAPVCTLMVGRLDDWMKVVVERDAIAVDPAAPDRAGIAVFKRAYALFQERGYRTRLLAAAYRHRLHWTELVGGDVVLTMPHAWQARFEGSGITPTARIAEPVDPAIVAELMARIPDFARAFEPDGLTIDAFDGYGPTVRTLRGFIASYHDLLGAVRDVMLLDPDRRPRA